MLKAQSRLVNNVNDYVVLWPLAEHCCLNLSLFLLLFVPCLDGRLLSIGHFCWSVHLLSLPVSQVVIIDMMAKYMYDRK